MNALPGGVLGALPARVRLVIYLVYALLGPVLVYLGARGVTGDAEYALYIGIGTAVGLTAAANVGGATAPSVPSEGTVAAPSPTPETPADAPAEASIDAPPAEDPSTSS